MPTQWGETESYLFGKHQAINGYRRAGARFVQCCTKAHKTRLVDRIGLRNLVLLGEGQSVTHVRLGVGVNESLLPLRNVDIVTNICRTRIHHRPLDKPGFDQFFHCAETLCCAEGLGRIHTARKGDCRVTVDIYFCANGFDNWCVDSVIVALPTADGIIGVEMQYGGPRFGTPNRIFDDFIGQHRNFGLAVARSGSVEGNFKLGRFIHQSLLRN